MPHGTEQEIILMGVVNFLSHIAPGDLLFHGARLAGYLDCTRVHKITLLPTTSLVLSFVSPPSLVL